MDKLKPVLAHKFWILFGLALIIPLVGWWLATSNASEQITQRWETLDEKKPENTSTAPNQEWIEAVAKVNQEQDRRLNAAARKLWNTQKSLMTWPEQIATRMGNLKHLENFKIPQKNQYRTAYFENLEQILKIVDPIDPRARTGKVAISEANLPYTVPRQRWAQRPPMSKEMWNAQEDLWLTRAILEAIARTNEGSTSIGDAVVRQVQLLMFYGGSRGTAGGAAGTATSSGEGGYDEGYTENYPGAGMGMGMAGPGMGGGYGEEGAAGGQQQSVDFDPVEEFGPPDEDGATAAAGEQAAGGSGGYEDEATYTESMNYGGGGMGAGMGGMGAGMGGATDPMGDRYIDNEDGAPFKTRGFYLKVRMDHTRLPELLGELASMPWPTQIVRVHQASAESGGSGRGGYPGGSMGGGGGLMGGGLGGMGGGGGFAPAMPAMGSMGMGAGGGMLGGGFGGGYGGGYGGEAAGYDDYGYSEPASGGYGTGYGIAGGNRGAASQKEMEAAKAFQDQYRTAMSDPYLADVVIAGLMSIYNPPPEEEASPEQQAEEAPVPLPDVSPTEGTAPEAGVAAPEAGLPLPEGLVPQPPTTDGPVPPAGEGAPAAPGEASPGLLPGAPGQLSPQPPIPETDPSPQPEAPAGDPPSDAPAAGESET